MARSLSKDVEHAVNTVIEAMVRKLFEVQEKLKQKESDFLKIHDALVNHLEKNIVKHYEHQQFSIEGERGSFNLKGLQNRKVIFANEEKTVNVPLERIDLVVKPIDLNKDKISLENEIVSESHQIKTVEKYKKEEHLDKTKNVENTLADLKSQFFINSQIRGQMEVLNHLKSLSHKGVNPR